jgi:transposase InsO family protein
MVIMELSTRRVTIAGIIAEPTGQWVEQMARGLVDGFGGVLAGKRYLIHDRGVVFTEKLRDILGACGVETLKLPARSPNLNAQVERWIRGIRGECLDHLILFSESALRKAIAQYVTHFHQERPQQGLGNKIIEPEFDNPDRTGEIQCRTRLGGLLKYYYREAA